MRMLQGVAVYERLRERLEAATESSPSIDVHFPNLAVHNPYMVHGVQGAASGTSICNRMVQRLYVCASLFCCFVVTWVHNAQARPNML